MNLTILISTYERDDHFLRLLNYYSLTEFKGFLLIGEGSTRKTYLRKKKIISKYKNLNINYIHAPGLVFETLKSTIRFIKTKYIIFLGDDDYLVKASLKKFLDFLEKNKNINGIYGDAKLVKIVKNKFIHSSTRYSFIQNQKNTSLGRIKHHLGPNYSVNLFAIQRTKNFLRMINYCTSKEKRSKCPERSISEEILPTTILAAFGKYSYLKGFYLVRTVGHSRIVQNNYFYGKKNDLSIRYLLKCLKNFTPKTKQKELISITERSFHARSEDFKKKMKKNSKFHVIISNFIISFLTNTFPKFFEVIYNLKTSNQILRKYIRKYII